jgi:nucleotide-binding universal stress UspA family protein
MKILLAVDSSEDSRQAIEVIAGRPRRPGTEAKIIHVVESAVPPLPDLMGVGAEAARREHDVAVSEGHELLNEMAEKIRGASDEDFSIVTEIITAGYKQSPQQVIVEEAQRFDADLVMVGSRGTSGWKRALLGSVSAAVVQHAPCSVEVVRKKTPGH